MESTHEKALRLINVGKVAITFQNAAAVNADVSGDHGEYLVLITQPERAVCTCPATSDCSHILAVLAKALFLSAGVPVWVSLMQGALAAVPAPMVEVSAEDWEVPT